MKQSIEQALGMWSEGPGPLHRKLSDAIRSAAEKGRLASGERLPSERDLAQRLAVSRSTVVTAYDTLRSEGVLESRQGSGTYLRVAVSPDMRHLTLTLPVARDVAGLFHTLEVRRALEAEAAALCTMRAGDEELAVIEDRLEIMEAAFRATDGMSPEEDWEFHQAILRASGNPLFEQITAAMYGMFHKFWEFPLGVG